MPATTRSGGNRTAGSDRTKDDGAPTRPENMSAEWNKKWDELTSQLPAHILRKIDVHQIKSLATLLLDEVWLSNFLASNPGDDKKRRLYLQTVQQISRASALFGMSPSDRRRLDLEAEPSDGDDEWDFITQRMANATR